MGEPKRYYEKSLVHSQKTKELDFLIKYYEDNPNVCTPRKLEGLYKYLTKLKELKEFIKKPKIEVGDFSYCDNGAYFIDVDNNKKYPCLDCLVERTREPNIKMDEEYPNTEFGIGGVYNYIIPDLNDIYSGYTSYPWKVDVRNRISSLKNEYIIVLDYLVNKLGLTNNILTSFSHKKEKTGRDIKNKELFFKELDEKSPELEKEFIA